MPYVNITKDEMAAFMDDLGFKQIELPHVYEYVWAKAYKLINTDFSVGVRVYSSISNRRDTARNVGTDSVRVCAVARHTSHDRIFFLGKSRRVYRVEGWRKNLKERLDNWKAELIDMRCAECGYPMVLRRNKTTGQTFYGCIRYYDGRCTYTAPCECDHKNAGRATTCPDCRSTLTRGK